MIAGAAVLTIIVGAIAVVVNGTAFSPGLTANSTCHQFLDADEQSQQKALFDVAIAEQVTGSGSPLALIDVKDYCSRYPSASLGKAIAVFKGQWF